jgi:hypothetical protein
MILDAGIGTAPLAAIMPRICVDKTAGITAAKKVSG